MPTHEESCLLCKRLDSSLEIYKLVLISQDFSLLSHISLRFFLCSCICTYTRVSIIICMLVCRADPHYILNNTGNKTNSKSESREGKGKDKIKNWNLDLKERKIYFLNQRCNSGINGIRSRLLIRLSIHQKREKIQSQSWELALYLSFPDMGTIM